MKISFVDFYGVKKYTLTNEYLSVDILEYGATINSIKIIAANSIDVALGYDTLKEYQINDGYIGACIGRCGNRINKGHFVLNNNEYQIYLNDGNNSLHGGLNGFNSKVFESKVQDDGLYLSYLSKDMEENYPGNLKLTVKYSLDKNNLVIEYFASCDQDTICNLTNHCYFNLNGQGEGSITNHFIKINSQSITEINNELIPTGSFYPVVNTPFDFNVFKQISQDINKDDPQIKCGNGYDHNFVLNKSLNEFAKIVEVYSPITNIQMGVYTDMPGVQFYSGNFLDNVKGKQNAIYNKRDGFCLETQNFPDAINHPNFPSVVLKKDEKFSSKTVYSFSFHK